MARTPDASQSAELRQNSPSKVGRHLLQEIALNERRAHVPVRKEVFAEWHLGWAELWRSVVTAS